MASEFDWLDTPNQADAGQDFDWLDGDVFGDETEHETARQLSKPLLHARKAKRREFITGLKREALTELIGELPPPDTDLWIVSNGSGAEKKWHTGGIDVQAFDFGSFLPVLVKMLGDRDVIGYVSTWTMNAQHGKNMIAMLADGRLAALTVFTDPYFSRREAVVYAQLVTGLQRYPDRGRYLSFKNHVKSIALAAPDGRTCVIVGSANLSAQPRCEGYVLSTAPDVYQFYRDEFFEAMLAHA